MSGIVKGVKKVFKAVTKIPKAIGSAINKVHKKLRQSKIYKIALTAAAVYFGGAALIGMAGGGGAAAGLSSAWGGLQGAGSALMAGNFSGAASALGSGFMGTYGAAAATGTALAGTGGAIAAGGVTAAAPAAQGGLASFGLSTAAPSVASAATTAGATAGTTAASSGGLLSGIWNGLGEAGKAAVVTSGVNMAGQMLQGHAAEKAAEEERERRTYWGVDGAGRTAQNQPNLGNLNYATPAPPGYTQPPQWQPKTLDDLINETRNRTNANSGLLWG